MQTVAMPLGERSYEVLVGEPAVQGCVEAIVRAAGKTSGIAILVDESLAAASSRTAALTAALAMRFDNVNVRTLPAGERCKNFAELERTCEWLADNGFDRSCTVLGLGGGATTDHAGFAAAIYLRGVNFVLLPTTLLSMVDASVGGKTAVDLRAGKNLVGAFHQPRLVIADLNFLASLPAREQAAGMAEIIKAGLIADAGLFDTIERQAAPAHTLSRAAVAELVTAAIKVKVEVVSEDERESGRRAILNFGHTLGHALESASGYDLLHGEAVGLGMLAALQIGVARGVTEPGLLARTTAVLAGVGLPVDLRGRLTDDVIARIEVDKKRRGDTIRFVLVPAVGQAVLQEIPLEELRGLARASNG